MFFIIVPSQYIHIIVGVTERMSHIRWENRVITRAKHKNMQALETNPQPTLNGKSIYRERDRVIPPSDTSADQASTSQPLPNEIFLSPSPFGIIPNPQRGRRHFTREQYEEIIVEALMEIQQQTDVIAEFSERLQLMNSGLDSSTV